MKTNVLLSALLLTLTLLFAQCSDENSTNETPQGLGKAMFDALQEDDKEAFEEHYFKPTDRDELLRAAKNDERLTDEIKNQRQEFILTFIQTDQAELAGSFEKIREKATSCGIQDWSEVEFVTTTFDQRESDVLTLASIKTLFRYKGLDFSLRLPNTLQTERGWLLLVEPELSCQN